MSENLDDLLEKIQREGVDKANEKAAKLLADAEAKAKDVCARAEAQAKGILEKAEKQAEAYAESSKRTIRQAAANTLIEVEGAVTRLFEKLLSVEVSKSMADTGLVEGLVAEAVRAYADGTGSVSVAAGAKLCDALRAKLAGQAAKGGVDVVLDETAGNGFRVLLANGRIEHNFTGQAVAEALAAQLRPSLAELLK